MMWPRTIGSWDWQNGARCRGRKRPAPTRPCPMHVGPGTAPRYLGVGIGDESCVLSSERPPTNRCAARAASRSVCIRRALVRRRCEAGKQQAHTPAAHTTSLDLSLAGRALPFLFSACVPHLSFLVGSRCENPGRMCEPAQTAHFTARGDFESQSMGLFTRVQAWPPGGASCFVQFSVR